MASGGSRILKRGGTRPNTWCSRPVDFSTLALDMVYGVVI